MHTRVPLNACNFLVLRIAVNSNNLILEKENYVAHLTASKNILLQMNEHALKNHLIFNHPVSNERLLIALNLSKINKVKF